MYEIHPGKTSEAYDIQEIYRWIIDHAVIQLLADKKLKKSDFITTEHYHTRLREKSAKLLLESTKSAFNTRATYKKKQYTYQNILQDNVQKLANYLQDKHTELKFTIPELHIRRTDDIKIRELIKNMTPEERRARGINKSTLWYQKKNLQEGKKIAIYEKVKTKINSYLTVV